MQPDLEPFTTMLDLAGGRLDPEQEVVERRLRDMRGMYLDDRDEVDRLVYRVRLIPVPETGAHIFCSTTVLEPGTVGSEYHMTKGHFHEVRDRGEFYLGLAGEGLLLMATEDGRTVAEPLRKGSVNYIPGGWAHRSVNTGDEPLVFFSAFVADAGHDYATIETQGFPELVMTGDGGPRRVPNPRYDG